MAVVCLEADIDSNAWIAAYTAGTTNVSDRIRFLLSLEVIISGASVIVHQHVHGGHVDRLVGLGKRRSTELTTGTVPGTITFHSGVFLLVKIGSWVVAQTQTASTRRPRGTFHLSLLYCRSVFCVGAPGEPASG